MTRMMTVAIWGVVILALVAVAGAVVVGNIYSDPEVSDEPYEEALRWDADHDRLKELGWNMRTSFLEMKDKRARLAFTIRDNAGAVKIDPARISAVAMRPAGELDDIPCAVSAPRSPEVDVVCNLGTYGKWDFVVKIETPRGTVRFVERSYMQSRGH